MRSGDYKMESTNNNVYRLSETDKIKCQWCNETANLDNWEQSTYRECKSREMKRKYTSLYDVRAFKHTSKTFYKCPCCGKWLRGSQLTITDAKNSEHLKLGGESIIKTNYNRKHKEM